MVTHIEIPSQVVDSPILLSVKNGESQTAISYLGSTTSISSLSPSNDDEKDIKIAVMVERYYLLSLARELLPNHRVGICNRYMAWNKDHVRIVYKPSRKIASYQNLARCNLLWLCAPCATIITEKRRQEIKTGIENWKNQGGTVLLATFTLSHKSSHSLAETLSKLDKAYKRFFSGSYGQDWKDGYEVAGFVKALEVTWGYDANGWHPHLHVLIFGNFTKNDVAVVEKDFKLRWVQLAAWAGASATFKRGVTVIDDEHFLREYVAKYGHMPTKELWNLESEVSKANVKKGRDNHFTPFELLRLYGDGWKLAGTLFLEFAEVFKGKNQLVWSQGLKKRLGITEMTDQQILDAEEQPNAADVLLSELTGHEWRRVREMNLIASLLIVASDGDALKLEQYLKIMYIR